MDLQFCLSLTRPACSSQFIEMLSSQVHNNSFILPDFNIDSLLDNNISTDISQMYVCLQFRKEMQLIFFTKLPQLLVKNNEI